MVFYRGWGILTAAIFVLAFIAIYISVGQFGIHNGYSAAAIFSILGAINFILGRYLNRKQNADHSRLSTRHSLFWIPMEWWTVLFLIIAVIMLKGT